LEEGMKVLIVYHSIYGHVQALAKAVQGAQEVIRIDVGSPPCPSRAPL
jgi:hypothetical protein